MPFFYILLSVGSSTLAIYLNIYSAYFLIIFMVVKENVASFNLVKYVIFNKAGFVQIGHLMCNFLVSYWNGNQNIHRMTEAEWEKAFEVNFYYCIWHFLW